MSTAVEGGVSGTPVQVVSVGNGIGVFPIGIGDVAGRFLNATKGIKKFPPLVLRHLVLHGIKTGIAFGKCRRQSLSG